MDKELKELLEKLEKAQGERKEAQEKLEKSISLNSEGVQELKTALKEKDAEIAKLNEAIKSADEILKSLQSDLKRGFNQKTDKKSAGETFIKSEQFKDAQNRKSNFVNVVSLKAITGTGASAGALVNPYRDPEVYRYVGAYRPLRVRDLIPSIPVNTSSVEIMRMTTGITAASPQGTSAGVGAGEFAAKAEKNLVFSLVTVPVATIAHWIPASRQVLADAPQLQGIIDTELIYGLDLASDNQLLLGDGTGQNITGIMNDSGISDIGKFAKGTTVTGALMLEQIRKAITKCQAYEYYNITGVVLNPADLETIELSRGTDGHYLLVPYAATSESVNLTPRIWRIPVVVTNAMPQGNFLLGDWTIGAKLYDREDASIRISESHSDFFVKNGIAILGEERYALGVNRPKAFTKGSFEVSAT
jgi:HK97 family phage major capsid protein